MKKLFCLLAVCFTISLTFSMQVLASDFGSNDTSVSNSCVAAIGTVEYTSLQLAIDAVLDNTQTEIVLYQDVSEVVSISEKQNIILDLNEHKIEVSATTALTTAGTLEIKNGSVLTDSTKNGVAIAITGGTTTISSGTVSGYTAITMTGDASVLNVAGTADISCTYSYGKAIYQYAGTTNITGGTINARYGVYTEGGHVYFSAGTVSGTYALYLKGTGLTMTGGVIENASYGIYSLATTSHVVVDAIDGAVQITASTPVKISKGTSEIRTGSFSTYEDVPISDDSVWLIDPVDGFYQVVLKEDAPDVVEVDGDAFKSMQDAMAFIDTSAQTTVTLLADCIGVAEITANQNIVLELNGYGLYNYSVEASTIINNGTLVVNDSKGTGGIYNLCSGGAIENYATLTVNGGEFDGMSKSIVSGINSTTVELDVITTLLGGTYVDEVLVYANGDLVYLLNNIADDVVVSVYNYDIVTFTENVTIGSNVSFRSLARDLTISDGVTFTNNGSIFYNATYSSGYLQVYGEFVNNNYCWINTINIYEGGTVTNNADLICGAAFTNYDGQFVNNDNFVCEAQVINDSDVVKFGAVNTLVYQAVDGDIVQLLSNVTGTSRFVVASDNVTLDLNGFILNKDDISSGFEIEVSNFTITNGTLNITLEDTPNIYAIAVYEGSSLTLDNVDYTTDVAAIYVEGEDATINVINNSSITAPVYCITTNAATTDNHNVVINVSDSTFTAGVAAYDGVVYWGVPVMINVPGTMTVDNCVIVSNHTGILVRGGTAKVTDTTIELVDYDYTDGVWGSGNNVPYGALVLGNVGTSYQYATDCTIENITFDLADGSRSLYMVGSNATNTASLKILDDTIYLSADAYIGANTAVTGDICMLRDTTLVVADATSMLSGYVTVELQYNATITNNSSSAVTVSYNNTTTSVASGESFTATWDLNDSIEPTITGVEDLQFYDDALSIVIMDENLASATLNGKELDVVYNGSVYTATVEIEAGTEEIYTIEAADVSGNMVSCTFITYVGDHPVDSVLDSLDTEDMSTIDENVLYSLCNEMLTDITDDAKDDAELVEALNKLDAALQATSTNITVVSSEVVVESGIDSENQAVVADVVPAGLALAVYGADQPDGDVELMLSVTQLTGDGDSLSFEIKPMESVDGDDPTVIDNDRINSPITFKLYLNDDFQGTVCTVKHVKEVGFDLYENLPVYQDEIGNYVMLTVSEFSTFIVSENSYDVTVDGTITSYKYGDTVTLDIPVKVGYTFVEWTSDDVTVENNSFTMPEQDVTINAVWQAIATDDTDSDSDTDEDANTDTDADVDDDTDSDDDDDTADVPGTATGDTTTALPIALSVIAMAGMVVLFKKHSLAK